MQRAVRLVGAGRSFGAVEAVRPLDVEVVRGRCVGVIGHNGSGKSTLLQLIAGRLRATAGVVEVCGVDVATPVGRGVVRERVSVGGAVAAFYPDLTVREHLELVAAAHGVDDAGARVDRLLGRFDLAARDGALPGQLSSGMRQKLDLACAWVRPFELLLLDEPDRGLDPAARRRVWADVEVACGQGTTVLVAAHQLEGLDGVFDEVWLFEHGALVERGPLGEVRRSDAARRLGLVG